MEEDYANKWRDAIGHFAPIVWLGAGSGQNWRRELRLDFGGYERHPLI